MRIYLLVEAVLTQIQIDIKLQICIYIFDPT